MGLHRTDKRRLQRENEDNATLKEWGRRENEQWVLVVWRNNRESLSRVRWPRREYNREQHWAEEEKKRRKGESERSWVTCSCCSEKCWGYEEIMY